MRKFLLGTGNQKKIDLYKFFLRNLNIGLVTAKELSIPKPLESGANLDENAIVKAEYYFKRSGLPTLADDGGFEIPALDNFPGVHSHRFALSTMTDEDVIEGIIEKMSGLTGQDRKARMRVVLVLQLGPKQRYTASGQIEGVVPEQPYEKRMPHFPYRSLLYVTQLHKWFYDVTEAEEEQLGYRVAALKQLLPYLIKSNFSF